MSEEYWEPQTLKIGDRVQVRLSAECDYVASPNSEAALRNLDRRGHGDINGCLGVVEDIDSYLTPHANASGHRFRVLIDGGYMRGGRHWQRVPLAAIELLLLVHECLDGWVCEEHPVRGFPHDDCGGPGMPCRATGCTLFIQDWKGLEPLPGLLRIVIKETPLE